LPPGQETQALKPEEPPKVPAMHERQDVELEEATKVPAAQLMHDELVDADW